jgi:HSP20 family molecular chaperone IbpA
MNPSTRPVSVPVRVGQALAEAAFPSARTPTAETETPSHQVPLIDIHEGPDGLVLEADLPGATEDNLTIQLEANVLTLQARIEPRNLGEVRPIHEEYRPGEFFRSFILSDEVDRNGITAELKHGVLRLTLPKAERAKPRRIEIKASP